MSKGIIINGCSGSGKTTLGKALAKHLEFQHLDLDDYYWRSDTVLPFTEMHSKDIVIELLSNDMSKHPYFVMSGSIGSILWDVVSPLFDLAVLLSVPVDIRLKRVQARAFSRFGERTLPGGDLYKQHKELYRQIEAYDTGENPSYSLERHEKWAAELQCPVLRADGTKPIYENVAWIAEQYLPI